MRPIGVGERRFIQCLPDGVPLWKMMIQQGCEGGAVVGDNEVQNFMEHDVIKGSWVASSPTQD